MTIPTARAAGGPAADGSGKITREAVLAAALQIIDRDGAEALSMRRTGPRAVPAADRRPPGRRNRPGRARPAQGLVAAVPPRPARVLVHSGHRFAGLEGVPVAELATEPLLLAEEARAPEFNRCDATCGSQLDQVWW